MVRGRKNAKATTSPLEVQCYYCNYKTKIKSNLRQHITNVHIMRRGLSKERVYTCPMCVFNTTRSKMTDHYISAHDYKFDKICYSFDTMSDFKAWKVNIERIETSRYIVVKGTTKLKIVNVNYFRCHRDGFFHSKGTGKRLLKAKGTNKMNGCCPSDMKVLEDRATGYVQVHFSRNHFGHSIELDRLPLMKQDKDMIAEKLAQKLPLSKVLDEIHSSKSEQVERIHLITRKDVLNIASSYKLKNENIRRSIEGISPDVESWVKQIKIETNVVRFFKPQGILVDEHPKLNKSDFVLIVFNDMQLEYLKTYGNEILCIDRTHSRSKSDYELISVLVIDELRQCFPCSFLLSNRIDSVVLELFISIMSRSMGKLLKPEVFMSDIADVFDTSWSAVMGDPIRKLFCPWHVEIDWRKGLNKIKKTTKRVHAHQIVKKLMQEENVLNLCQLLEPACHQLKTDVEMESFGRYFEERYSKNYSRWAQCLSTEKVLSVISKLECRHKAINTLFMKGKKIRRLDKSMASVMKMIRDKVFDNSIILHKGSIPSETRLFKKAHQTYLLSSASAVNVEKTEAGWKVHSDSSASPPMTYEVTPHIDCRCRLRCDVCHICIHSYRCSCAVSTMEWLVCRHIHTVAFRLASKNSVEVQTTQMHANQRLVPVAESQASPQLEPCSDVPVVTKQHCQEPMILTSIALPILPMRSQQQDVPVNPHHVQGVQQILLPDQPLTRDMQDNYGSLHQQIIGTNLQQLPVHHSVNHCPSGEEQNSSMEVTSHANVAQEWEELIPLKQIKCEDNDLGMRQAKIEALKLVQDIFDAVESREQLDVFTNAILPVLPTVTAMKFSNPCTGNSRFVQIASSEQAQNSVLL